jgi:hypothetical protein
VSFEVYLQCFERGEPAGIDRDFVRSLFPVIEDDSEPDYWSVRYDSVKAFHVSVGSMETNPSKVTSLGVMRPITDMRLWDALLQILRSGNVVLYWPGCSSPLVASEPTTAHLPSDMVETLGKPIVVKTSREIREAIEND